MSAKFAQGAGRRRQRLTRIREVKMKAKNLLLGGGLVLGCAVVGAASFRGSEVNSIEFDQLARVGTKQVIQVYGKLDAQTIKPIKGSPNHVEFKLLDEKTHKPLQVVYDNVQVPLPANFPAASHAKATGTYDTATNVFTANSVLTKCPSKYEYDTLPIDQKQAVDKFQKSTGLAAAK